MEQPGLNAMFDNLAPQTNWESPKEFPNWKDAKIIGIDTETRDPNLIKQGPGGVRRDGELIGFSISLDGNKGTYFPLRHAGGGNMENTGGALQYLKDICSSNIPKVGANILYDMEWIWTEGISFNGILHDVQIAEPLIDENKLSYSLDSLSWEYLEEWKDETLLKKAAETFGYDPKGELWKLNAKYVGPYAEKDAELPVRIFNKQVEILKEQGLYELYQLESNLLYVLIDMRTRGVRVDLDKAEKIKLEFAAKEAQTLQEIKNFVGVYVDVWSGKALEQVFIKLGIKYPKTEKGGASFESDWLERHPHPVPQAIVRARHFSRAQTHINSMVLDVHVNGRVHSQYRQVRDDDFGTVSGRFSSTNPNLQQVPSRHPEIGKRIRSCFIPDEGAEWAKLDYSQQEPRLTVHYAGLLKLAGAQDAVDFYANDPAADFHQMTADMAGVQRREAKDINLGLTYSMGAPKLARNLGLEVVWDSEKNREVPGPEAQALFDKYHSRLPWLKALQKASSDRANQVGFVRTILGRRRRFNMWEDATVFKSKALEYEQALKEYNGRIRRAFTYRALNAIIQGSAADMVKQAMVTLHKEGYPIYITVHDECDCPHESDAKSKHMQEIMEHAVELIVPVKCDLEIGPNWGEVK